MQRLRTQIGSNEIIETLLFLVLLVTASPTNVTPYPTSAIRNVRFDAAISWTNIGNQYQNVTHEGDFVISDNETFTIENSEYHMNGKITVNDTSTLIIKNSKFFTVPPWHGDSIVLMNQAHLVVTDATVIFRHAEGFACEILAWDDARVNITYSTLVSYGHVVAHNNSAIYVGNSTMTTSTTTNFGAPSGVATFDASTSAIENSTIDGVFVWDTSSASIRNSAIGIVRSSAVVNIRNSKIEYIEAWDDAPAFHIEDSTVKDANFIRDASAHFTDSSLSKISAYGNATVWLIGCTYGGIETRENATVFVGLDLPLFGLVVIQHNWIPILQLILVILIVAIVITVLLIVRRRRTRRIKKEKL